MTATADTLALYGLTQLPGLLDEFAAAVENAAVYGDRECEDAVQDRREIILDTVAQTIEREVTRTIDGWSKRAANDS